MDQNKDIDLNLRHYIGHHLEVIKEVKLKIRDYLKNSNLSCANREVYSAIYNALTYYQNISELSIPGESDSKTFLDNTIDEFNKDVEYLSKKYNSKNPNTPKVIQAKGRVKSPISAMGKILEKISEYIRDGMNLTELNNSLRDFIGLRIIVDAPPEIKALGKKAEADFCYQVFHDLLEHRGILRQINGEQPLNTDYSFITVNTIHDPNKQQKLKERPKKEGFNFSPEEAGIFIPESRPEFVEEYDDYFKDYKMYPKASLYQRLHTCTRPYFEKYIPKQQIPTYIVPSTAYGPSIEYQVCTLDEENFAEHGKASHKTYKGERDFHRLGIPLFMKFDENIGKIRLTRLDEAIEEFYGYTFESMFNIDYQTFLRTFDRAQRDEVLAGNLEIDFNERDSEYVLKKATSPVEVSKSQPIPFIKSILKNSSSETLGMFYEQNGLLDSSKSISESRPIDTKSPRVIQFYKVGTEGEIEKISNPDNETKQDKKHDSDASIPCFEEQE